MGIMKIVNYESEGGSSALRLMIFANSLKIVDENIKVNSFVCPIDINWKHVSMYCG